MCKYCGSLVEILQINPTGVIWYCANQDCSRYLLDTDELEGVRDAEAIVPLD